MWLMIDKIYRLEQRNQQDATRELHHELEKMKEIVLNQNIMIGELKRDLSQKDCENKILVNRNKTIQAIDEQNKELEQLFRRKSDQQEGKIGLLKEKNETQADEIVELRRTVDAKNDENSQLREQILAVENQSNVPLWSVIKSSVLISFLIALEHILIYFWLNKNSGPETLLCYEDQGFLDQKWSLIEMIDFLVTYGCFYQFLSLRSFLLCSSLTFFTKKLTITLGLLLFFRRLFMKIGINFMNVLRFLD